MALWQSALPDSDEITNFKYLKNFFGAEFFDTIVYESNLFYV